METCQECGREFKDGRGLRLHRCKPPEKDKLMTKKPETKTTISLSPEERGIADRVTAQDTDWFTLTEADLEDFSLQVDPMFIKNAIPEAWKMQEERKYAFRWCERTTQRIDELTKGAAPPLRWALVTRTTLPGLEKYIDPVLGCVVNLDQALLFKPWGHHELVVKAKQQMADDRANSSGLDAIAKKRADDKLKMYTDGDKAKIGGSDEVQYEDGRSFNGENDSYGDLVVDE